MRAVVRVAVKAVETLLLSSGVAGLFLRPYFTPLVDSSAHAIIWLGDSCLLQALSQAKKVPGALGLVRNWRGLGLRVPAAMLTAAHMVLHNAAPPQPKRFFEVTGVPLSVGWEGISTVFESAGWTAQPLRSFVRQGKRTWVATATTEPTTSIWQMPDDADIDTDPPPPALLIVQEARARPPAQRTWAAVVGTRAPVAKQRSPVHPRPLGPRTRIDCMEVGPTTAETAVTPAPGSVPALPLPLRPPRSRRTRWR